MSTAMQYGWYVLHAIDPKYGRECCSHDSLSFHYIEEELMRSLYHFVYYCPKSPVDMIADEAFLGTLTSGE